MATLKTTPTTASVTAFLDALKDETRRKDCRTLVRMMKQATKAQPKMWGPSIVGFGTYHYRYDSGREGDWFLTGFSPRKQALTLYIMAGFSRYDALLEKLGTHKTGRSCLYVKKLADVDLAVLQRLIDQSVAHLRRAHA
ncbi:MAG: DUF1801 domain-containing protein [Gemmatimonadota bacterium]|nr:DUF1801 domain-containing protein [Gemmatimonadota bacterium]